MRRKIDLYIGGMRADLNEDSFVLFNYATEDLSNPTIVRNSWSKQVTLPGTPTNDTIFGYIARSDRESVYGAGYTGIQFDATRRTPFEIIGGTGEVVESGYLKLDSISKDGNGVCSYSVSLYGGMGGFLYSLSYDEDGNKRTLADIKYTGSSATSAELDFTVNKTTVKNAWNRVTGNTSSYTKYDILNFAPCYNGLPSGTFDADKALARPADCGLPVPSGYTAPYGWALVSLPEKHTDIEMKDMRSYLQRPVLSMKKLITAMCQSYNNGGYTVDLDSSFFNSNNPYWEKAWLTLPMLDTLTLSVSESEQTASASSSTSSATVTFTGGVQSTRYVAKVDITPFITGTSMTSAGFWYMAYWLSATEGYQTWIKYTVTLQNGNTVLDSKSFTVSSLPSQSAAVPAIDFIGSFSPSSSTRANFGSIQPTVTLEGYGADRVVISRTTNFALVGTTGSSSHESMVCSSTGAGDEKLVSYKFDTALAVRVIASTAVRSGSTIGKSDLLGSMEGTPADYLLSYCKMFGLMFHYDKLAKKVSIMTRSTFYGTGASVVDLTPRVDKGKGMTIKPFAFDSRWYELALDDVPSEFLEYYKTVYGRRYGSQRINTGFEFNADTKDLLEGNIYKSAAEVQQVSKYYVTLWGAYGGETIKYPSVFLDAGGTYQLRNSTGQSEDLDIPVPPQTAVREWWGSSRAPGYDMTSRIQLHKEDGGAIDGRNVLVFYDGWFNPQSFCAGAALSDDLAEMGALNDNTPCWILNWGDYSSADLIQRMPRFHRYLCSYSAGMSDVVYSWDFGKPAELRMPLSNYAVSAGMYQRFWATYIGDRYDDDSKVLNCRVDLRGLQVGQDLLRLFYSYDGALWSLNKISNYSLTTYDTAECELVKVQDMADYTAAAPTPPVTEYYLYADARSFNVGETSTTRTLNVTANVAWTATSSQSWLTLNAGGGTGDGSLQLTIAANSGSERTATVTLHTTQTGVDDVVVTVVQAAAATYYMDAQPRSFSSNYQPQTGTIVITSNITRWELENTSSWISLSSTGGSGNANVTMEVDANEGGSARTGTITLRTDGDEPVADVTITVTQEAHVSYYMSANPTTFNFSDQPNDGTINILSNIARWNLFTAANWIHLDSVSGGSNDDVDFSVDANTSGSARNADIVLSTDGDEPVADVTITVTQSAEAGYLSVSPTAADLSPIDVDHASIAVSSNGSWSVATGAGWLSASPSSGTGNGSFILSATDNNTGSSRSTSVTVSSGQAGVSAAHVAVSQGSGPNLGSVAIYNAVMPGQVPTLTINANATYCDFKIDSTGAWQITSDVAWLTEYMSGQWTGSSAANGRSVYAAVSPNTTGVQRVGHLTIKLTAWPNITATFTITQNA